MRCRKGFYGIRNQHELAKYGVKEVGGWVGEGVGGWVGEGVGGWVGEGVGGGKELWGKSEWGKGLVGERVGGGKGG